MEPGGVTIESIDIGDPPAAWEAAGFRVQDGVCRVGTVDLRLVGRQKGHRILGWCLAGAAIHEGAIDGLSTTVTSQPAADAALTPTPPHPNGVIAIDHIVLFTPDVGRTVAAMRSAGLEPRLTRSTDTYGAPFLQTFFRAGEVIVELIGPEEPSGTDPAGFFGLAHTVTDLDETRSLLADALGTAKDAVQPGRRIATLRHKVVGMSVATAFMSPEPDNAPDQPL